MTINEKNPPSAYGSPEEILKALNLLAVPGHGIEIRAPKTRTGVVAGYCKNLEFAMAEAMKLSGRCPGVYFTLNVVNPALFPGLDQVVAYAARTTTDSDITWRRWLFVDLDPVRPSGVSSTEKEHEAAIERAREVQTFLAEKGWPEAILADSGNGAHLLFLIDLPNDSDSTELVRNVLVGLSILFSDDEVDVDLSTYNASRICKLYGTLAAKGENTAERPHRIARILTIPEQMRVVERHLLEAIASKAMPEQKLNDGEKKTGKNFDLRRFIQEHSLPVKNVAPYKNGGTRFVLRQCPWNPEHTNLSAFIIQFPNGAISAGCLHKSCENQNWQTLRDKYEPGRHTGRKRRAGIVPQSAKQQLLELTHDHYLFCGTDGEPYADTTADGHRRTFSIKSLDFNLHLIGIYYAATGDAPSEQTVKEVKNVLMAKSRTNPTRHQVYLRVGEHSGRHYLDLANETSEAIEVDAAGYRLVINPPVRFRRSATMKALPHPVAGGSVEDLKHFLHLDYETEDQWILILAFILALLRPRGPFPLLALFGEQGSAKSTLARVIKRLVDPGSLLLRSEPKNLEDLMIAAINNWLLCYDNLSFVEMWLSNALCQLSTGGGMGKRTLWTNADETSLDVERPVILNAIEQIATRGDLLSRAIIIDVPIMVKRRSEKTFWKEFNVAQPRIFGALLDVCSKVLAQLETMSEPEDLPRLADFALASIAAEKVLGWREGAFLEVFNSNQNSNIDIALGASPIVPPLRQMMTQSNEPFQGTAGELLDRLTLIADENLIRRGNWPTTGSYLSRMLQNIKQDMRKRGLDIEFFKSKDRNRQRLIRITKTDAFVPKDNDSPF